MTGCVPVVAAASAGGSGSGSGGGGCGPAGGGGPGGGCLADLHLLDEGLHLDLRGGQQSLSLPHCGDDLAALRGHLGEQLEGLSALSRQVHALLLDGGLGALDRRDGELALAKDAVPEAQAAHQIVEAGRRQGDIEKTAGWRLVHGDHPGSEVLVGESEFVARDLNPALVGGDLHIDGTEALRRGIVATGQDRHLVVQGGDLSLQPEGRGPGLGDRGRRASAARKGEGDGQRQEKRELDGGLHETSVGHAVTSLLGPGRGGPWTAVVERPNCLLVARHLSPACGAVRDSSSLIWRQQAARQ